MTQLIRISKQGINVLGTTGTVPNNLIFDSEINTFKIVATGTVVGTITSAPGTISIAHGLGFSPPVTAYARKVSGSRVVPTAGVSMPNALVTDFGFKKSFSDGTNAYFVIDSSGTYTIKYYCFEIPLV